MAYLARYTDQEHGTLEVYHPSALGILAADTDTPRWQEAMNGPYAEGFQEAMVQKIDALTKDMDAWDVIDRLPSMNVLPSTWASRSNDFLMTAPFVN
jgi:hypothetical protein